MLFADGVVVVFPYMFVANLVVKMGNNDTSRTFFFLLPPFNVSLHRILCSTQTESDTVQFRWRTKFTLHSLEEKKNIWENRNWQNSYRNHLYRNRTLIFIYFVCVAFFFFALFRQSFELWCWNSIHVSLRCWTYSQCQEPTISDRLLFFLSTHIHIDCIYW